MDQASKEAWQWVESTEAGAITIDHIQTSYRLKVATCKPGKCKKNCKINPRCLVGLGEKVWLEDLKVTEEEQEDPCDIVRKEGNFVGLTNLGATCYINSLLQLWFHNPIFRKAIYSWVPFFDPSEKENKTLDLLGMGGFIPNSPVGKLQLLFAQMQFSKRSCVNPTSLITSLGIDTTTQQDAQEFSKLFLNLLEDKLSLQTDMTVSTMVYDQFRGEYEYVTRCSKCQKESSSPSAFYELDLSLGSKSDVTLDECLAEFLHEEKLEGTDQYFCENCSSKQNATRSIRLRHLPAMLNIQLLRFVFDRKTGLKKKVSSMVHFPFVVEMSNYVKTQGEEPSSLTYDLSAVLIHRGPSAYSGHYIAHIKDPVTGTWYKFNDEVVQKIEGTNFKLGIEEDLEDSKKSRAGAKVTKGSHGSSNAYMLVYSRRDAAKPESVPACSTTSSLSDPCSVLPPWVQTTIFNENENFEAWTRDTVSRRDESLKKSREKHSKMRRLYGSLPCNSLDQGEFVPTQWLSSWLGNDEKLRPIDNSILLCEHGKLNPEKFREYKLVSSSAADELYAEYSGGRRLNSNDLCWDCVTTKCITSQLRSQLDNESKLIANLLKSKIDPNQPAFWIGKESLRSWKKMVLERMVNSERESMKVKNGTLEWENRPSSASSVGEIGFNEDLLCPHDKLTADEGPRRLIHSAVWEILHRHFPEAIEFSSSEPPCEKCIVNIERTPLPTKESNRLLAMEQKSLLQDLFRSKNRPDPFAEQKGEIYVIAKEVIDKWRSFVRDSSRKEPVTCMSNAQLLCHHGGLLHRPSPDLESESMFVYLWPCEWEALSRFAKVDRVILLRRVVPEGTGTGFSLDTEPAVCESCLEKRLEEERRSQLVYSRAAIYVRQVDKIGALTDNLTDAPSASAFSSSIAEDPDFQRPRLDSTAQALAVSCPVPALSPATVGQQQQQARRSSRQRRGRGEKEITVSSDQTLLDLKRDIMKKFQVAPFDQHLTCEGRDLNDNQATLASLRIFPGSVIILQADEPSEDPSLMEDYARTAIPEEGFKGNHQHSFVFGSPQLVIDDNSFPRARRNRTPP
ncbi:hypothetical protein DAPPUDRAFT_63211 [Daphnia pulex]|uniref:Ubiquitin carboxyl-terminal hydrolase 48 n=1 Tax=Daphnia pulex TaxID=6669 RepID=E9HIU7_DAPPU|nr:hypothetical protein DAPPUDRAFT_63211 [Daphnia pulex]|eukprot:EFX68348.1 hypothetical protein DAPPUDRAFT_63211 [Daphnia pulex]